MSNFITDLTERTTPQKDDFVAIGNPAITDNNKYRIDKFCQFPLPNNFWLKGYDSSGVAKNLIKINSSDNVELAGNIDFTGDIDITGDLTIDGDIKISATNKLYLDGGGDTYIYESAADILTIYVGGVKHIDIKEVGGVTSMVFPDNSYIELGTGSDAKIYFDGTDTIFNQVAGEFVYQDNGTEIYRSVLNGMEFKDDKAVYFGTGKDAFITVPSALNYLYIGCDTVVLSNKAADEFYFTATNGGASYMYHNNVIKIGAIAGGAQISGLCDATGGFADNSVPGIDDTFNNADGDIVTVSGGIITDISPPP